jgi:WD40 repeat protein
MAGEYVEVKHLARSSSLAVSENLLAVGNKAGNLHICDMAEDFKILRSFKLSGKYVGNCFWLGRKLLVCVENDWLEIDLNGDPEQRVARGHPLRVYSARYDVTGKRAVSCCNAGLVKVWDVEKPEITCLSTHDIQSPAYSAIFLPTDGNFVVCGGHSTTIQIFDWTKCPVNIEESGKAKPQKINQDIWGKLVEEGAATGKSKRNKKKVVAIVNQKVDVDDVASGLQNVKIEGGSVSTELFY